MSAVQGRCDRRFAPVWDALQHELDTGAELGASVCVVAEGETVVDIWGGYADPDRSTPWTQDTIVNAFSLTKTMTALAALVLVERGELDPYASVSRYWPEFAANGKDRVEVRHLLSHTSGVSGWDQPVELADIYEPESSAARLAEQAPWWEPGSASGYHALNQGHLVGEVVRRITGASLGEFFSEQVAKPLDADFHIGIGAEESGRIATLVPPPCREVDWSDLADDDVMLKTMTGPAMRVSEVGTDNWRQAEIGAANGHGNARSVARVQSVISHGGVVDGQAILSPRTVDLIFDRQSDGVDLALRVPLRFGIGFALPDPQTAPIGGVGRYCWWTGDGGSLVVNDLEHRLTFAYVMNRMGSSLVGSERGDRYLWATYGSLCNGINR